jgi:glycosyltransferase involved in cell wall biosynthesis
MKGLNIKLKIIGEGPIKEDLVSKVRSSEMKNIDFLGYVTVEKLKDEIRKSMFVVVPSEWYENNPGSIIEGFALGKPVIGARIGGIPELVKDNETGLTFESGNSEDLKAKITQLSKNAAEIERMGRNARRKVEEEFNTEIYYEKLMNIYKIALNK